GHATASLIVGKLSCSDRAPQQASPASLSQERLLDGLVADFLGNLAHANRSAHTHRAYATDLASFVRFHPGPASAITTEVMRSFFATIAHLAPATRARKRRRWRAS